MAITYPLSLPSVLSTTFAALQLNPATVVGVASSPFTGQSQQFVWPGQWWAGKATLPPLNGTNADAWVAFLLALNGQQGTFTLGDPSRKTTRGTASGSWTVGASAVANTTTLPIAGGSGAFALGDYLQIGVYLHRIINLVDSTHVDVFPRLRSAYANGTAITYTNPKGLFRLSSNAMQWTVDVAKKHGMEINFVEAL